MYAHTQGQGAVPEILCTNAHTHTHKHKHTHGETGAAACATKVTPYR